MEDLLSIEDMAEMISVPQMTNKEAIAWLNNLITSIGEPQHSSLWHYEKALSEIKDLLGVLPSAQPKTDEENELKFYYVESIDDYWIGQRLDNFYYADWHDGLGFVWSKSRYLPWGEHVVNEQTLWKEHTYPSEPKEIPFTIWIVGFLEKYSADRPRWIPCSERPPRYDETDETSEYLVTDKEGRVRHCCLDPYMPETFVTVEEGMIVDAVAWRSAPEPYQEATND